MTEESGRKRGRPRKSAKASANAKGKPVKGWSPPWAPQIPREGLLTEEKLEGILRREVFPLLREAEQRLLRREAPYLVDSINQGNLTLDEACQEFFGEAGAGISESHTAQEVYSAASKVNAWALAAETHNPEAFPTWADLDGLIKHLRIYAEMSLPALGNPYGGVPIDPETGALRRGPRTASGKSAIKYNAMKHGLLSKEVFLDTDDYSEFLGMAIELQEGLAPATAAEDLLVDRIIGETWRLKRALRVERQFYRDFAENELVNESRAVTLSPVAPYRFEALLKVQRYKISIERSLDKNLAILLNIQHRRKQEEMEQAKMLEAMAEHVQQLELAGGEDPESSPPEGSSDANGGP